MKVTKTVVLKDFEKLKSLAKKGIQNGDYDFSASCVQRAANLMYNSNLRYKDDELESDLEIISRRIFPEKPPVEKEGGKKRLVFYDFFALDNRGLTEQYLEALFDSDYELFFVACNDGEKSFEIYKKLDAHMVPYVVIKEQKELLRAALIKDAIQKFSPDIILAHTSPSDLAGLVSIKAFEGRAVRYLINITDHAFWLGTSVFDFFIEFRNYGFNISKKQRGIPEEKLLPLPYYPIINKDIAFGGFDFDATGKKLLFSGGSIYKIQGSPIFLDVVKHVLDKHDDAIFLYLGNGDYSYLDDFIKSNNFQGRFFYYPERKDIYEIFKRCDLYLNTYPLIGALMTQYACIAGKVPITLNENGKTDCNNVDELLLGKSGVQIQYDTKEACEDAIDFYLENPAELKKAGEKVRRDIIDKKTFRKFLLDYLAGKRKFPIQICDYDIDIEKFSEPYIARFNKDGGKEYCSSFVCRNMDMALAFFKYFIFSAGRLLVRKIFLMIKKRSASA